MKDVLLLFSILDSKINSPRFLISSNIGLIITEMGDLLGNIGSNLTYSIDCDFQTSLMNWKKEKFVTPT